MNSFTIVSKFKIFILLIVLCSSCQMDKKEDNFILRIRLREDVDCLHPIMSRTSSSAQIESLIMPPIIEFSLDKIELSPLLLVDLPKITSSNDSIITYEYDILPEAKWDDGSPITSSDYAFTIKAALNPFIKNSDWRSYIKNIRDIKIDSINPKHISTEINKNYILSMELCGNINIYQETYYDSNHIMNKFKVKDLIEKDTTSWSNDQLIDLKTFANSFQIFQMCKSNISGSGPYKLKSWDSGSKIILQKKDNLINSSLIIYSAMI